MNRTIPYITAVVCIAWAALAFGLGNNNNEPGLKRAPIQQATINAWFPPFYTPRDTRPRCNVLFVENAEGYQWIVDPHALAGCGHAYCDFGGMSTVPWVQGYPENILCNDMPLENDCTGPDGGYMVRPVQFAEVFCDEVNACDYMTIDCSYMECLPPGAVPCQ